MPKSLYRTAEELENEDLRLWTETIYQSASVFKGAPHEVCVLGRRAGRWALGDSDPGAHLGGSPRGTRLGGTDAPAGLLSVVGCVAGFVAQASRHRQQLLRGGSPAGPQGPGRGAGRCESAPGFGLFAVTWDQPPSSCCWLGLGYLYF